MFRAETVIPTAIGDTLLFLYLGSFNPADQFTNAVVGDDDDGAGLLSRIDGPFADGQYVLVVTGYNNSDYGIFTLELDGAVLGFVPLISADDLANDVQFQAANLSFLLANTRFGSLPAVVRNSLAAREQASVSTHSPDGGAIVTGSGLIAGGLHVWADTNHRRLDGDGGVSAYLTQFQAGVDVALSPNVVAGLAVGGADLNSSADTSDLEGYAIWAQPYVGFASGHLRGVASLSFGFTDYDRYTAAAIAGEGSSDGFGISGNLFIASDFDLGNSLTLSPFASLTAGQESLADADGILAGASDPGFGYFDGSAGVELSRAFATEGVAGRGYLRAEAQYRTTDAPEDSFASANHDRNDFGGGLAAGIELAVSERVVARLEASGDAIGNGASEYGGLAQLSIRF